MGDDVIDVSELAGDEPGKTEKLSLAPPGGVRRFQVRVVAGPALDRATVSTGARFSIGSHPSNDLVIDDSAVSRFHCEIVVDDSRAWLVDLGSQNGTILDGVPIARAVLRDGSSIELGRSHCRFELAAESNLLPLSSRTRLGSLVGVSTAMRTVFAILERAAKSDVTVLIEGETGTGKEGAAEALHAQSARAERPFLVVDCGAVPPALLESELFGHERGAFTGAVDKRMGVFAAAEGGTVFLDEIGELPLELQPKLLRVLEQRSVKPVGSSRHQPVDVRIVAATNRDLRALVNEGTFRSDLYFRLAVVMVRIPPLRSRPDDTPLLVKHFLSELDPGGVASQSLQGSESIARMQRAAWPGNVRELRNYLQRCLVFEQPLDTSTLGNEELVVDTTLTYGESKRKLLETFERRYLEALLARHHGNVAQAARGAGMDRVYIYKMMHRHGLKPVR